jgi:hypothetical protein
MTPPAAERLHVVLPGWADRGWCHPYDMPDARSFADTTTLIDASATLDPADRALLNLWVNRGLDDDALAELSHLSVGVITARRHSIVERLSTNLELSPQYVNDSLQQLAAGKGRPSASPEAAATNGAPVPKAAPALPDGTPANGHVPSPSSPPGSREATAESQATGEAGERRSRGRGSLIAVGVVLVAVLMRGRRRAHSRW